jgi:hypothetical protein
MQYALFIKSAHYADTNSIPSPSLCIMSYMHYEQMHYEKLDCIPITEDYNYVSVSRSKHTRKPIHSCRSCYQLKFGQYIHTGTRPIMGSPVFVVGRKQSAVLMSCSLNRVLFISSPTLSVSLAYVKSHSATDNRDAVSGSSIEGAITGEEASGRGSVDEFNPPSHISLVLYRITPERRSESRDRRLVKCSSRLLIQGAVR